jgi:hypothetical protein
MSKWLQKPPLGAQIDWSHPLARGLVGCWLMNEGSGARIYDLSGNGNHGTLTGGPLWKPGKAGVGVYYDGTDDYANLGTRINPAANSFSIFLRLLSPALNTGGNPFWSIASSRQLASPYCGILIAQWPHTNLGALRIQLNDQSNYHSYFCGVKNISDNVWHDVVVVVDRSKNFMHAYIDGKADFVNLDISAVSGSIVSTHAFELARDEAYIAGDPVASRFPGHISGFAMWHRALSAQEVSQFYAAPYCFIQPATKIFWQMPLFHGSVMFDRYDSPAGSFWATHNPDYGAGSGRTRRYHQPVDWSDAGGLYSYKKGKSGEHSLGWNRMPAADLAGLIAFFDAIGGRAKKFYFTDLDGWNYTVRLHNADSLTWREVDPGFYAVQVDLDLS